MKLPPVNHGLLRGEWKREFFRKLESVHFGRLVAEYYHILGFRAECRQSDGSDYVDVSVYRHGEATPCVLVHCRVGGNLKIDVILVQDFHRAMLLAQAETGAFFTTGEFTETARIFNCGKEYDLVACEDFLTLISRLPPSQQIRLWEKACAIFPPSDSWNPAAVNRLSSAEVDAPTHS